MKTRNPYNVTFDLVNRFRGMWDVKAKQNIDKAYAEQSINAVSTKIGQLDSREGQDLDSTYSGEIINGGLLPTMRFLSEGSNIFMDLTNPYLFAGIPNFAPPSDWGCPPWQCVPDITCTEIWTALSTPVGEQKAGGVFPDCFTVSPWTCQDLWDRTGTPIEYQKADGVYPDCFLSPPQPPFFTTCADMWALTPDLSAYEESGNANVDITDGDLGPCWTQTCQDMWDQFPSYSANEVAENADLELIQTGGTGSLSDCWDFTLTLNCENLYSQFPDWDEFRKEGAEFPDCWDFTTDIVKTCDEFWSTYNTPVEYRNIGGKFPNCVADPDKPDPKKDYPCYHHLWSIPDNVTDIIDITVEEGYTTDDTRAVVAFEVEASLNSNEIPFSMRYTLEGSIPDRTIISVENNNWYYDYVNIDPPCRRQMDYGLNFIAREGVLAGTSFSVIVKCYFSMGGGFSNILVKAYIINFNVIESINVEQIRKGISERYAVGNNYLKYYYNGSAWVWATGDGTAADVIAPANYDTVAQQTSFWNGAQNYVEILQNNFIRSSYPADLTGLDRFLLRYSDVGGFKILCQDSGGSLYTSPSDYGWTRKYGVTVTRGKFQAGDTVGSWLYSDLKLALTNLTRFYAGVEGVSGSFDHWQERVSPDETNSGTIDTYFRAIGDPPHNMSNYVPEAASFINGLIPFDTYDLSADGTTIWADSSYDASYHEGAYEPVYSGEPPVPIGDNVPVYLLGTMYENALQAQMLVDHTDIGVSAAVGTWDLYSYGYTTYGVWTSSQLGLSAPEKVGNEVYSIQTGIAGGASSTVYGPTDMPVPSANCGLYASNQKYGCYDFVYVDFVLAVVHPNITGI